MITKTIMIADRRVNASSIKIGNEGDNNAECIRFVLPARLADASVFLFLSIDKYSDVVKLGEDRIYTPTRAHTQLPGKWTAYLQAVADEDVVWHSDTFQLVIGNLPPVGEQIEQQYPTAIEEALRATDEASRAVEQALLYTAAIVGLNARAETLPPGSDATVRLEDIDGVLTIVYGIPRGKDGGGTEGGGSAEVRVDGETIVQEDGVLRVNTTDKAEADNTQPITSAGVYTVVGNINAILETI